MAVEFSTNYNMLNVMSNYATLIIDGAELNLRNQVTQQQLIMPVNEFHGILCICRKNDAGIEIAVHKWEIRKRIQERKSRHYS